MTVAEPVVIESVLTRADWSALQAIWGERARARVGRLRLLAAVVLPLVAGGLLVVAVGLRSPYAAVIMLGAVAAALASSTRLRRRVSVPQENGLILGRVRIELSPEGIRTERDCSTALTRWSVLQGVSRTDRHLFLWVDAISAYIVPLRDLPAGVDANAVVARVASFAERPASAIATDAGLGAVAAASDEAGTTVARRGFMAALVRRLTWRAVPESEGEPTEGVTAACALAALGVWLAYDRYAAGARAEWYPAGATGLAWYAGGLVALAWVLHRASGRTARFGSLMAALAGALPLALALGLAVHRWAPSCVRSPAYALLAVAAVLHVARALGIASGTRRPGALLAGMAAAALFAWGTGQVFVYPHLWFVAEDEEGDGAKRWAEGERLLFEQADRIDAAAGRLAAGRPGRPDVFFLGFAGVGEQKVFSEEVRLAERVVTERYAAAGRSLLLVNDRRDREAWPLATVSSIERALSRLGERMDCDEDVLFLFLSSHGFAEPELSVSNGIWPLAGLDGRTLRAALDASGIRWRVIVISACHSGAFIGPLADERTIVLTSAAADRTSSGCGDDRDVTDFGAAFVRDALPRAESLTSAFEQAKREIARAERERRVEPSSPQASVGHAMEARWSEVEAERRSPR